MFMYNLYGGQNGLAEIEWLATQGKELRIELVCAKSQIKE